MVCVDKNSPEFVRLARKMNLDSNILEQIIHKYYRESGQEDVFPSDIYINAQLGNTEYEESMPTIRSFWQASYQEPKVFSNEGESNREWVQAINYFPKEAIVRYKDADGNFVLRVRKPIEKLSLADGELSPVYDAEGNMIPVITEQDERDYELISRQMVLNSEKSITFAPAMTQELNQKVLSNLEQTLQLDRYEGRSKGNAGADSQGNSSADVGLLGESQTIIKGRDSSLRATEEQRVLIKKDWSPKQIKALEYLAKGIENGKFIYQRFPQEATEGFHRGGKIHAEASLLLRGYGGTNEEKSQNLSSAERYERDKRQQPVQEAVIENWAKAQGIWFENLREATRGMEHYEDMDGGEAQIYRKDSHTIRKILSTVYFTTPQFALDRITLHNTLFPAASLKVVGFGRDEKGQFQFIVDQPFVEGIAPTLLEVEDFMKKAGYKKSDKDKGNTYTTESIYISDLHNENVIKTPNGNLVVIDADLRLNTPDLQRDGTYKIDNSIATAKPVEKPKQPSKKERQVIGLQPFTFNDGTTVTVPFKPNEQQAEALNAMNDFLNSNETTMTLSGYAGTGKTSLMEIIAQKAKRQHKAIMFSATTNKAAAVLKSRVSKAGFDAQTLNKVFGINVEIDSSKAYNARNLVTALKEAQVFPGTTVVIDEASMINEENYGILNRIARENGLKIIYVGDKAQLAPVNENQVSKVFRNSEGRVIELTQVERTDDNAILKEATNIRNGKPLSGESSFNERGEGVGYLTPKSREEIGKVIRQYIQGLKDNPNFFRILAWQNKTVTAYNDYVRTLFGYTDYIPHVEEPLTGYANWGWNDRTRGYRFINSEAYKVTKVGSPQKTSISIDGKTYKMEYVPVTAENNMGEIDTYNYMDIRGNQENLRVAKILAQKKTELWDKWRHTVGREAKTNIRLQINAIDQFLFVNDKIEDTSRTLPDGSYPLLQQKVVDFGYALTVHKSQGSTFTHVMMDEMDIAKSEKNNAANSQELYKGEDRWVAPEDQQTSISDEINLGIDKYETKPQTTPSASATATNPNAANVRQQLEYVAVSRATNTVTILSNNVKKEGNPLGTQQTQVPQAQLQIEKVELPKGFKESTSREGAIHLEIGGKYGYPEYVNAMLRHLLVGDVYVSYNSQTGKYIIERGDRNGNYKTKELNSLTDEWIAAEAFKPQIARALEKYFKASTIANSETDTSQLENQQQLITKELVDYMVANGLPVKNRADMEKFLQEHPNSFIQQAIAEQQEMQDIKAKAIADGTFMKAPNGNPTNLNERQWLQVRTKNFINWFGDWLHQNPKKVTVSNKETVNKGQNWVDDSKVIKEAGHYYYTNELGTKKEITKQQFDDFNNGKDIVLSEKTYTEKKYDHSKVLDENGEPKVMYHITTTKGITIFDRAKSKHAGFWFSSDPNYYVKDAKNNINVDVVPAFLNIREPNEIGHNTFLNAVDGDVAQETLDHTKFDGWITRYYHNPEFSGDTYSESAPVFAMATTPNQVKSAISNNGLFSTENDNIQAMMTPNGELFGFVDKDGNIYLDETIISPAHPIHEYTHLWDRIVAKNNPKLWQRGVELMKQTSEWQKVLDSPIYGQTWKTMKGMTDEKLEQLIASEVHARLTGEGGAQLLDNLAKEKGTKGIVGKLKQWILDFWKDLKATFSDWSDDDLQKLTLKDFNHMTVRDFADAVDLQNAPNLSKGNAPVKGDNIASGNRGTSALARKLTNKYNDVSVEYKGTLFKNSEHAYQTWKSGSFDQSGYDAQGERGRMPANKETNYQTMVEIITAKLQQHPELVEEINQRGGEEYLKASTHNVLSKKGDYWETSGQNKFIEALTDAYKAVTASASTKVPASYEGKVTPDTNTVFVFGSNPKGIHGAGAAAVAKSQFGAIQGQGEGMQGNAYALPTKDLDKAKGTRWYRPGPKEETEVKEWYKNHDYSEVLNHPLNAERTMTPQQIIESIKKLYDAARQNPTKQFKVSHYSFGQLSLNGYLGEEMLAMFKQAGEIPSNIIFNKEWIDHWDEIGAPSYSQATNLRTYGDAYTTAERDKLIQELIDNGYSRKDIVVEHVPATSTADDVYLIKVKDNSQALLDAVLGNTPAEQPQKVSLPSYEFFNDRYEDTTVDAAWKIPMLQELDKQLSAELTPEENNDILDRMTRILEAKNQEDLLNLLSDEPKTNEKVEQNLTEFEKMTQQINNLLDSNIISASEIRHVAELVVNSISDTITILQKEEGAAEKFFPNIQTDLDFKNASRKEIVEAIGINNLIHRAKQQFDPEQNDYEDFDTIDQADLIIDNWDAIMTLATDTFAMTEGFGIMHNYDKGGFATTQNSTVDFDNFNDYSNDPDAMAESEKDEQEHWQVEQRTIDVLNSMSQRVRLALHECYQMDKEGNKVMSKWGIAERINPRQAVNSILRWTQGSLTLEDMVSKMSAKATQNPWLNQLIERLSDKSGKETNFQGQFFGVFSKHFQPYSVVLLEEGKYHSIPVNNHPALSEAMQTITTQFKIGENPLFTDKGINRKLLGSDNTTDAKSPFNLHQALAALNTIQDRLQHGEQLNNAMSKEAAANIMGVCKIMGYPVTEEMLSDVINEESLSKMTKSLGFIVRSLDAAREEQFRNAGTPNAKVYNPFAFNSDNGIAGTLRNFLTPITDTLEDTAVSAFYDSGKMYQSYVTPSFMTKLMNKFRLEGQEFEDFIMQEYGSTEWFKSAKNQWDINKGWRNEWLRLLATDENARKVFDHKVELNFNKHNYMRNMSDAEYTLSLITEYFAETGQKKEALVPAWFRVPIMSNKPSSEFIKFYSYRGANYKDEIIYGLHQMFNQELSRIQTANMRNHSKGDADFIANFDTNGRKFNFLPFLNQFLEKGNTSELAKLLQKKINGLESLTAEEEARLSTLVDQAIRQDMENRVDTILSQWENSGIIEAAKNIEGIGTEEAQIRSNLENFLWNDNFASKNILQLTITDIAFYKDAEDLQKRLAQIHAPGIRGNVNATDYEGNKVTDGKYRTILIQGLQKFKTDLIANIAEVFDRKIAAAPESQKAQLKALKESLVGENGRYTKIDVTDGQAYSSPSSYRKKAFIFGKWSRHAEEIYQKLKKGDYNYTDLEVAFQLFKPFVYSHLQKDMGVDNAPIHQMPVPFQAKNSEYLLIMADALLQGEQTSRPNLLRAIYRIMEDSERLSPTKGIDTVQFDSAIKSGLQAPIDLNPFVDMVGGEEAAFEYMKEMIYKLDDQGNPSNEYNTNTYVHEGLYEDYCLQQEVPEHFKNHSQAHGSQIRMITPSDLDFYKNPNADHNDPNNQVFYEWTEPDGTKKRVRADEFRREYEETIAASIRESIDNLSQELHINSEDKKERNIALSKILQREILSSPRYGIDLIQACSVDKETGEFRIPKGDPIQAKRIEQLINSIIKNRVNKQKIAGGPIVQVTNFGASRQLHIRFNDKNGGLLMTREEYEQNPQKKELSQTDKFNARYGKKATTGNMTYEEYVKQNQAGIAYFEVFIPMWANEIFEKFSNEDGSINMEALEATDPELLKMISYRIPTEDKYSCAPMKAVGFMPREAGDAIMFPYELTEIDDSDFDVDKRYVMRKDIPIIKKPKHIIRKDLFNIVEESYKKQHNNQGLPASVANEIEVFLDSPESMRNKNTFTKWLYTQYQKVAYTTKAHTSGKEYRDNKIVDMTWAVLTNEMTADKILNPGGFDVFKRNGYMVAAYKNPANNYTWEQLQQMSIDELNKLSYTDKDLTWLDTQIQFYKQNAAAASLIGVFAVNKVAHATLESNDYFLAVDEICGPNPFTIASTEFGGRMKIDPSHDAEGNLIGKTIGAGVSASADAAKTPVLNLMNINMTTAGMFNTLLRLGMAPNDASLFMSQDIIERLLNEFNRENLTNYKPLSTIIEEHLSDLREKHNISDDSNINFEPLSREELVEGLLPEDHEVIDYKVLLAFQKVRTLVDYMRKPTFATRFNSISSAVGPLIIDNLIMEHKMEQFMDAGTEDGTHFYDSEGNIIDIDDIFYDHPILKEFSRTVDIAKVMFNDMPAGSRGFRNLLATLPEGMADKVFNDKKLLDDLSNFYQSYLLIASRMINPANLKNYIDGFPEYFNKKNFKEKYPDNALIQAIKMNVAKRTGRPFLSINITGIDESQKEIYRSAWIDLHKDNPELSKRLFEYCFFRAGIGFSPKTFMSLVPAYVKERLSTDLGNGTQATYVDTYRMFPNVNPNVVIDQWIRNNWDNNKLVPKKGGEGTHYIVDLQRGTLIARDPKDMADLKNDKYIKTRQNGQTYLWKQLIADETSVHYNMVKPLGNNGEYMEMSLADITRPLNETKETIEDMKESELQTTSPAEADAAEASKTDNITDNEKAKQTAELADLLMKQNPKFNKTQALNQIEKMKEKPDLYAGFLVNVFKQKGLNLSKEEAIKEFKKMC